MKFQKILLKISGETLADKTGRGISFAALENLSAEIIAAQKLKTQIAIVIGGGNFWRGRDFAQFPAAESDAVGMTATLLNGTILQNFLATKNLSAKVFSAIDFQFARKFETSAAREFLNSGGIPIFVGGTGNPFFTTDSAAVLRARQLSVDAILKATKVDGVFDADPQKNPAAKKFDKISFDECFAKNLKVFDRAAFAILKDVKIPLVVFDFFEKGNLVRVLRGEKVGTVVR